MGRSRGRRANRTDDGCHLLRPLGVDPSVRYLRSSGGTPGSGVRRQRCRRAAPTVAAKKEGMMAYFIAGADAEGEERTATRGDAGS